MQQNNNASVNHKKIDMLLKQVDWHVQANDADGVLALMDQIHKEKIAMISRLPEPYKSDLLDNLEFNRFALLHISDEIVIESLAKAEELSQILYKMAVIEKESIDQANNVLHQYFYEKITSESILVSKDGTQYSDWRSSMRAVKSI